MQNKNEQQSDEAIDRDPREILSKSAVLDMRTTSMDTDNTRSDHSSSQEKSDEDVSDTQGSTDTNSDAQKVQGSDKSTDTPTEDESEAVDNERPILKAFAHTKKKAPVGTKDPSQATILFFGTPDFSVPILKKLIDQKYDIVGVVTQPDKKKNKNKKPSPTPIKELAVEHDITVYEPGIVKDEFVKKVKDIKPDLIVTAAYGKILPLDLLKIPPYQAINIHPSLLPKYRGASPIQNALLDGQTTTGTTIMLMDEGMDTGDILEQGSIQIGEDELFESLSSRLSKLSADLLDKVLPMWFSRSLTPVAQKNSEATHCQLIEKEDGRIFWNEPAASIYNKYRAFSSWPGIFTFWKSGQTLLRVKLIEIEVDPDHVDTSNKKAYGEVHSLDNKVAVKTQVGVIYIHTVQLEGKKVLPIDDFLKGHPDFLNSKLQ